MGNIGGEHERDYAMVSVFGRLNYSFRDRYIAEMNIRRDGTSRFAPESRWGTFPSFSAGWRISEEDFMMPARGFINNLMLRGSWGRLGNTTSGHYDWQATYALQNNVLGGTAADGLAVTAIANPLLRWESVTASEVGLNALFLNQRLNVEVNLYNRLTAGILTRPPIFSTMGMATAPMQNTSDMRNRGIEVVLGWSQRVNNDFRFSTTINFAYNQNRIVRFLGRLEEGLNEDGTPFSNIGATATVENNMIRTEGRMFDEFFLRRVYRGTGTHNFPDGTVNPAGGPRDGMIRTSEDLQWVRDMITAGYSFDGVRTVSQGGQLWYGELIYADLNGDGNFCNTFDRELTGKSPFQKYTLGWTSSAEWRGFDLGMTWAGNMGMHFYLRARGINQNNFISEGNAIAADARERFYFFNPENPNDPRNNINAPYPRMLVGHDGHYQPSDHFLYNGSFIKLKFLQLGYTLPRALTSRLQIDRLRLFVSGENLLTFTSFPGMDPEIGGGMQVYPISRVISGGVSITF
jgi:TonB-linked SusC/RagA family outer membrane protein